MLAVVGTSCSPGHSGRQRIRIRFHRSVAGPSDGYEMERSESIGGFTRPRSYVLHHKLGRPFACGRQIEASRWRGAPGRAAHASRPWSEGQASWSWSGTGRPRESGVCVYHRLVGADVPVRSTATGARGQPNVTLRSPLTATCLTVLRPRPT